MAQGARALRSCQSRHATLNSLSLRSLFRHPFSAIANRLRARVRRQQGYFRKGQALEGMLQYPEAYLAYNAGLAIDKEDASNKKVGDFAAFALQF